MTQYRLARDEAGEVQVPIEAYWGASTQRVLEGQTAVTGQPPYPAWVWGMALIKRAAAQVNADLGLFRDKLVGEQIISADAIAQAIMVAADELLEGEYADQFRLDPLQSGALANHEMNVSEVIANLANEQLGYRLADGRKPITAEEHVNMGHTTADIASTAVRLGCLYRLEEVREALAELAVRLRQQPQAEIFALSLERNMDKLRHAAGELRRLGIGGASLEENPEYHGRMVATLSRLAPFSLYQSDNPLEALDGTADFIHFSGALRTIAQDLIRLATSYPPLPCLPAGRADLLHTAMLQLLGHDLTMLLAGQAFHTAPHTYLPLIAHNLFHSMALLINSVRAAVQ
jgi:fumarate hydratase, class II